MEMFFLLLYFSNTFAPVVMPQPYSKEQCEKLSKEYISMRGICIPAPVYKPTSMCNMAVGNVAFPVPCDPPASAAGYYCGQYPDKCIISKPNCVQNLNSGKLECN